MSAAERIPDQTSGSLPGGLTSFSTVSSKGQTTVPKAIRQALGTSNLKWSLNGGKVVVEPAKREDTEADPVIDALLALLDKDVAAGRNLHATLSPDLVDTMRDALRRVAPGDYDAPLDEADDTDFGL